MSKNMVADLLNSVLVKSGRKRQNVQRVKRSNNWSGFILVPPYCIPGSIDCPCDACDYCCKGQCNGSGRLVVLDAIYPVLPLVIYKNITQAYLVLNN